MKRYLCIIVLLISVVNSSTAQRPPAISSPDVHANNTVTFRFYAPNAKKVSLSGEFLKTNQSLTKDNTGIWSITVGPIKPDIYPYNFVVDSIGVADPNNTNIFENERFKRSIVKIPGSKPLVHSLQNVAHGKVN